MAVHADAVAWLGMRVMIGMAAPAGSAEKEEMRDMTGMAAPAGYVEKEEMKGMTGMDASA